MNEQGGGSKPAVGAAEMLSAARFQEELRRVVRFHPPLLGGDVLAAAVKKIVRNPAFTQSRLLIRMLAALTYQQGEFRRAELAAFDSDTLAMVINLMDAHAAGTSSREEWISAVDTARAALVGAQ